MNKLLLSSVSLLLLLVDGVRGFEAGGGNKPYIHQTPQTRLKFNENKFHESGRVGYQKRIESMPFGYSWNIGNGVSYMKMQIGGHQSGSPDDFKGSRHDGRDVFWRNSQHQKAGGDVASNKGRLNGFHENHSETKEGEFNLEKLKHFSQEKINDNLGNSLLGETKEKYESNNAQVNIHAGINILRGGNSYDPNLNHEVLNNGFGKHGFDIKNYLESSISRFEPSFGNGDGIPLPLNQITEEKKENGAQIYERNNFNLDGHILSSTELINSMRKEGSKESSFYRGNNFDAQRHYNHKIQEVSDLLIASPGPNKNFREQKGQYNWTATPTSNNQHFLPQAREEYFERVPNGNTFSDQIPFHKMNAGNITRFKKYVEPENGGRITRNTTVRNSTDIHLIGPGIYDYIDKNPRSDLVSQGSSMESIRDVSYKNKGKEGLHNLYNNIGENKNLELQNLPNSGATAYSYSRVTFGHTKGASEKPTWLNSMFDEKFPVMNKLLKEPHVVIEANNRDEIPLQDITVQFKHDGNTTSLPFFKRNIGKESRGKFYIHTNATKKNQLDDGKEKDGSVRLKSINKVKKETSLIKSNENQDNLFAENTNVQPIDQQSFESEHSGESNLFHSEHYHYPVRSEPEVREITKTVPVYKELRIPVPHPVHHPILIPVPVRVLEPFHIEIPVPVPVEKTVEVPVEKVIKYPVEKHVPVKVYKKIRVPVPKPFPVKVPVYKVKYIHHIKKKQAYKKY